MNVITDSMKAEADKLLNDLRTLHKAALVNPVSSSCAELVSDIQQRLNVLAHQLDAFKSYQRDIASGAIEYTPVKPKHTPKSRILRQASKRGCTVYRGL